MTGGGKTPSKATWADVMAASAEVEAEPASAEIEIAAPEVAAGEPGQELRAGEKLRPGDTVRHPKFGDCTVHRITENDQFVHMAVPNGKVRRLSLAIVECTFDGIEGGRRIFRTRVRKTS